MKKYVFLGNSSKPSKEQYESKKNLKLSNVSKPCLETAYNLGYEIYLGTNRKYVEEIKTDMPFPVKLYEAHTYRSIFNFKDNYCAYKNLMRLLSKDEFEVIHCNTPVGGWIGRICGKKKKINKIIYTAHGFHFYKGAPFFNNTVLKFSEKIMAHWTNAIITMNKEDYEAAKKFKLRKNGKVYFCHGVGIDIEEYTKTKIDKIEKRKELGLSIDDIIVISMGDLIKRKNYSLALDIISKCKNSKIKYLICGEGPELKQLKEKCKLLSIENQVVFLGYRTDIKELLNIADVFLFTSKQEGLPRSLMEAMASGLPCVVSRIRGNIDLIEDRKGGYICENIEEYISRLNILLNDNELKQNMGNFNKKNIVKYSCESVKKEIEEIYKDIGL